MADQRDKYFIDLKVDQRQGLSEMEAMVKAMTRLRAERRKINKELRDGVITERAHAKALDRIQVQLKGLSGRYREASNAASGLTKQGIRFRDKIAGSMTRSLAKLGAAFAATFAVDRIMQFGREVVRMNAELSDSFADVQKTTGLSADEVERLDGLLQQFDTRTSRTELLNLAQVAGRLNIEGTAAIANFVDQADKINVALGDVFGEDAALTIGKVAAAYGEEILNIGSAINELGNTTRAQEPFIVDFIARLQGTADAAGLSAADVAAYGAVFDSFGLKVESSSTALSGFFIEMLKNTSEFERAAGIQAGALQEIIGEQGANEGLLFFIESLQESTDSQAEFLSVMDKLGFGGKRAAETFLTLAANVDEYRRVQETANTAIRNGDSVMAEFETRNNTLGASIEKLGKEWDRLFASGQIADTSQGVVDFFIQRLREMRIASDEAGSGFAGFWSLFALRSFPIIDEAKEKVEDLQDAMAKGFAPVTLFGPVGSIGGGEGSELVDLGPSILGNLREQLKTLKEQRDEVTEQTGGKARILQLTQLIEQKQKEINDLLNISKKKVKEIEQEYMGWLTRAQQIIDLENAQRDRAATDAGGLTEADIQSMINDQIIKNHEDAEKEKTRITEEQQQRRNQIYNTSIDFFSTLSSGLLQNAQQTANRRLEIELDLLEKLRQNNEISQEEYARLQEEARRRQFEQNKRLRILETTVDGASLFLRSVLNNGGFPLGLAAGAGAAATTAAQVAIIAAQQFAKGGVVGLSDGKINKQSNIPTQSNGDNVLATVRTGEVILNKQQQAALGGANTFKSIGVPGFADGGLVAPRPELNLSTENNQIDYVRLASAMSSINVQTSIVEIIDNLANQNQITQLRRL